MFSKESLREMRKAFNKTDTSGYSDYQVAFGWIDKRPYAELAGLSSRVELGDLAIIALNKVVCPGRPARDFTGRCALMQAKLQDVGVSNKLTVLFGKNDASSANQQYLLSNWGRFDLFRHSTGGPEIGSFSLAAQDESYGWFMAAHRDSVQAGQQRAAWLCGPPGSATTCDVSIGEVIASVASFGTSVGVGARCRHALQRSPCPWLEFTRRNGGSLTPILAESRREQGVEIRWVYLDGSIGGRLAAHADSARLGRASIPPNIHTAAPVGSP